MSKFIPIDFDYGKIRIIQDDDGEPLFVAKDVAGAIGLGWKRVSGTMPHVPKEWVKRRPVQTTSGMKQTAVLTEQGLYYFLGRSNKPDAIKIQKKLAEEILPAIRKGRSCGTTKECL